MLSKFAWQQTIELAIDASSTNPNQFLPFQQQPQLQLQANGKPVYIKAIETFTNLAVTKSPITTSNAVAAATDLANSFLILEMDNTKRFDKIPMTTLNRVLDFTGANPGVKDLFLLKNICNINWTKSGVLQIAAPITTPPFSFVFSVWFDYYPD